ncbi:hypothetical protein FEM48_Zijuj04G0013100 [Ziziphus jujuba var. spinosa]|uniref:DUF7950 domain-containing protein n=1 Tax=Ziziphus jujuba var. spinosa TaxID=714518 RepID=A0A978VH06_ZIZJJ|nr:hypothetical protein FEM48_Zijuj04G0013100 [Ziziphus jujuba var. spinosa]
MDGGNGWHMASCGHDNTIINRMMLRFRPIAPKPASGGSFPEGTSQENKNGLLPGKRVKRKYVRVKNNPRRRKNNTTTTTSTTSPSRSSNSLDHNSKKVGLDSATITLQLMPENTDGQDKPSSGSRFDNLDRAVVSIPLQDNPKPPPTLWINNINFNNSHVQINDNGIVPHRTVEKAAVPPIIVESWVTVEFVTDTCMEVGVGALGSTDVERINNLDKDTCPGFVSDGSDRVKWVNEAYKNMVRQQVPVGKSWLPPETMTVWLIVTKTKLPNTTSFTCLVSLRYYWLGKEKCLKMVPCDVWRMDCGGFAWRLDVKAALSLGLS